MAHRPTEHMEAARSGQAARAGYEVASPASDLLRLRWQGGRRVALTTMILAWLAAPASAADPEPLAVELRISEGRVAGYAARPGPCDFELGRRVVEGQLEGSAIVGTVLLCHDSVICGERSYPFLGLPRPDGQGWVAQLSPDEGCHSRALDDASRLLIESVSRPGDASPPPPPSNAARKAQQAMGLGRSLLSRGDYARASLQFQRALSYQDGRWDAYLGLGEAELGRGNLERAAEALDDATVLTELARIETGEVPYLQARIQARQGKPRQALESLRRALRVGLERGERMAVEPDLQPLHGMPEFTVLAARVGAKRPSISSGGKKKR